MRKKSIRIFYSWQDDTDNRINRSFIKNCLDSALAEINKKSEIDEAARPQVELDHDTKGIPGIPDIANTILHKISSADLFVADLTFVSEYRNYNGVVKKVSNQNVVFELGFAFNVLGPSKIICLFNEAFGQPKDLLFDLQHRRWPILFNVATSETPEKSIQKTMLKQKLNTAIVSILTAPSIRKTKLGLHSPFSSAQHDEFEYLYNKLNVPVIIQLDYQERVKVIDWRSHDFNEPEKPWQHKKMSLIFLSALTGFVSMGRSIYSPYEFTNYIEQLLKNNGFLPSREDFISNFDYKRDDFELLLRTLGLISSGEGKFLQKIYKLIHWLEFNGFKEDKVTIQDIDVMESLAPA